MDTRLRLSPDTAAASWDVLLGHVERFVAEWESTSQPPSLERFAPLQPIELRRMTLAELVKVDLEYRWRSPGQRRLLEEYLREFPELSAGEGPPVDLIYEEYHIRQQAGELVLPHHYYERFPERQDELRRLLSFDSPDVTTSLVPTRRIEDVNVGDRLDDFDLLLQLGKGAFATVFLARQRSLQRLVALKVSADRGSEPQTLAQLDHPHIVRVFDQRNMPERRMRLLYMQYVPGGTLHDVMKDLAPIAPPERSEAHFQRSILARLEDSGQISPVDAAQLRRQENVGWAEVVCRLGAQLAEALDYAHQRGVLHRDVKPANVLLSGDGRPKLADFNISFSSQIEGATPAAYFGGSLAYMSPEQLEACDPSHDRQPEELDGRSDLYSLAVMLWELLFGERPFRDEVLEAGWSGTLRAMTDRRRRGVDPEVWNAAPLGSCGEGLKGVLLRALSPDNAQRHASGRDLARDLNLCLQPRVRELLAPPVTGWRSWVAQFPVVAVLVAVLVPNALAGLFNYVYNEREIIAHLESEQAKNLISPGALAVRDAFERVQMTVNGIAFPLGALAGLLYLFPLVQRFRGFSELDVTEEEQRLTRRRTLLMGPFAALLGIVLWIAAGAAYPVSLHWLTQAVDFEAYLHFGASMLVCGLISAAYPFFLVSMLSVRVYYPHFLHGNPPPPEDEEEIVQLGSYSTLFLFLAAAVPMGGVMMLAFLQSKNQLALMVLSLAAGIGFGMAFYLHRVILADLSALRGATVRLDLPSDSSSSIRWGDTLR